MSEHDSCSLSSGQLECLGIQTPKFVKNILMKIYQEKFTFQSPIVA